MKEKRVYRIEVYCTNCGHKGTENFDYGTEVPARMTCPNCGCLTMEKGVFHKMGEFLRDKPVKPWHPTL